MSAVPAAIRAEVSVRPDDPVFAGHYPGFPILPGLFLLEYVHTTTGIEALPTAVDRVKFVRPVYPGDQVVLDIGFSRDGDEVRCDATASVDADVVAEFRLRYPEGAK
ncbi:3-hydroxyacyl-ACP dehydratase FabZ family protein [Kutzneria buriramensis]|uniref:3-hydroxyacyl-[acyl-carrier-protein] dehydratase n=1 Tax=Kutzneria buriramensis TaxID=1045776 RepID=A0A3E0HPY7_9PSEU|nr:beta-hydroxyacyl-ACP dehydratase [Kutzneria buriramensis]REH48484.1 3-hydroxyacyl-[acyl-carrier-protein] dehydratase [Kutzneria buriramensis]